MWKRTAAALTLLLLCGACATNADSASEPEQGPQIGPTAEAGSSRVLPGDIMTLQVVQAPGVGAVVVDREEYTLYRSEKDTTNPPKSSCLEPECTLVWVPLLAAKVETKGVDAGLVGLMDRPDGTKQVTLSGRPLYRFVDDEKSGDATGNGTDGQWFAVAPNGEKARG